MTLDRAIEHLNGFAHRKGTDWRAVERADGTYVEREEPSHASLSEFEAKAIAFAYERHRELRRLKEGDWYSDKEKWSKDIHDLRMLLGLMFYPLHCFPDGWDFVDESDDPPIDFLNDSVPELSRKIGIRGDRKRRGEDFKSKVKLAASEKRREADRQQKAEIATLIGLTARAMAAIEFAYPEGKDRHMPSNIARTLRELQKIQRRYSS